jgi:hypothetical protein
MLVAALLNRDHTLAPVTTLSCVDNPMQTMEHPRTEHNKMLQDLTRNHLSRSPGVPEQTDVPPHDVEMKRTRPGRTQPLWGSLTA